MHQVHALCTPVYNCHHIKSCHSPVKQYITTHHNSRNTKVAMARAALCVVLCAHSCILFTVQCPPQGTSLEVSLPPYLPRSSLSPLPPSSARFIPPLFPSLHPCLRSFLTRSLPQPSLPSSTPAPNLPHIIASSCPLVAPSPYSPLAPSLPPSCLAPSVPLPASTV